MENHIHNVRIRKTYEYFTSKIGGISNRDVHKLALISQLIHEVINETKHGLLNRVDQIDTWS